ncbi:MAG: PilZ domain-containing protein [Armatimonadetes bacterium]|nr:PilZ domain-containing protein [Armatimonadota bacterium]
MVHQKAGSFKGTRVRVQRVRDARFFTGWTLNLDRRAVVVRIPSTDDLRDGDDVFVQVFGAGQDLSAPAVCRNVGDDWARFDFACDPRKTESTEEVRLSGAGVVGTLRNCWGTVDFEVLDVSPGGVGGVVPYELMKGDELEIALLTPTGPVEAQGTVRYCRPEPCQGGFRIGFSIRIDDRTMLGRWRRVFLHAA